MEVEKGAKRKENADSKSVSPKKRRIFSAREFRSLLQGQHKTKTLQDFLTEIKENKSQDCALEYLQKHGNISEILRCMENDATLPPVVVFEIVNELLLKIITHKLDKDAAYESCQYLLNHFIDVVNKMLGFSSSAKERIIVLKLLTSMAAYSSSLSKDILVRVNFHLNTLELLTKTSYENRTVRKHYIYFVTAMLIDIQFATLSLMLTKRGVLTSIIPGLQYDDVDTVCVMLTVMKNNILENQMVTKTTKMKTFNTMVIKNIVNLYNWKGPSNLKVSKKVIDQTKPVDELQKAKVNECVHDFLLTLCTSHKFGVIFRDPLVGMGKKNLNPLILTVLESMESPWEHSYAGELVLKISSACPDITKFVWIQLKEAIQPRFSSKWLKLVNFVEKLTQELEPSCLNPYVKELNVQQISHLITTLVAPSSILKTIIPDDQKYDSQIIRHKVLTILILMIKSLQCYLTASEKWLNPDQHKKVRTYITKYIAKNFPSSQSLIQDWNKAEESVFNSHDYLISVFEIFSYYNDTCPELLEVATFSADSLKELLETINADDNLQVIIIDTFLKVNPNVFSVSSESFDYFLSFLIENIFNNVKSKKFEIISVLRSFLQSTKLFDNCHVKEVDIWINGIFSLKCYNENLALFLSKILKFATSLETNDDIKLSPLLYSILNQLDVIEHDKSIASYLNFCIPNLIFLHLNVADKLYELLKNSLNGVLSHIDNIFSKHITLDIPKLLRIFGKNDLFHKFNCALNAENFETFLDETDLTLYPDLKFDLLKMGIFYFSKLLEVGDGDLNIYANNLLIYVNRLEGSSLHDLILQNVILLKHFSILNIDDSGAFNCCTKFITTFIQNYVKVYELSANDFRFFNKKIVKQLLKILKNPAKYSDVPVVDVVSLFKMHGDEYVDVLSAIVDNVVDKSTCSLLVFYLERFCGCANNSNLPDDVFRNLLNFYVASHEEKITNANGLSLILLQYLTLFPGQINLVDDNVMNSLLQLKEYEKSNTDLIIFLLKNKPDFLQCLFEHLDNVISVKGVLYPVLQCLRDSYIICTQKSRQKKIEKFFSSVFEKFEEPLHKILRKPQKASNHLVNTYQGVCFLIELNFQADKFGEYVSKVQKFEVTKVFHVHLLYTIFKKYLVKEIDDKALNNSIITFGHLLINILKKVNDDNNDAVENVADCFLNYLNDIGVTGKTFDLKVVHNNESFKLLMKLCLKHGVSNHGNLLDIIGKFITLIGNNFEDSDIELMMEMLTSHSEFLDVLLDQSHACKLKILSLMLVICKRSSKVMRRNHVPILLSSYGATLSESDKMNLELLKMYDSCRNQTGFQEFKPYLWGNAGANHYSIKTDISKALFKQPRMADILSILQENTVLSTIKNYNLYHSANRPDNVDANHIYDLEFLLPIFSSILQPENVVHVYHFTKSGGLSLTVIGLSSNNENVRKAACHVLSKFYFHVDARQTGTDNVLWLRFIEAICKGLSADEDYRLNNFVSIFLARMAYILTQSIHVMYGPLSRYLGAKSVLDFSSIPELYTFFNNAEMNHKEYRQFLFEVLTDGLIEETDYTVFFRSMALKLLLELYSSCVCDPETRVSILDILTSLCRLDVGVRFLCAHNSFIEYLIMDVEDNLQQKSTRVNINIISKTVNILYTIQTKLDKSFVWEKLLLTCTFKKICDSEIVKFLPESTDQYLKQILSE